MNLIKYFKSFGYIFIPLLFLVLIISLFDYFNIIGSNVNNYLKLFITAISMLIGGIYIGSKTDKLGWLEGLKIGLGIIVLFFIIGYLAFDQGMTIKTIIYYFILLVSSVLGSMIGISRKKTN